MKKIQYKINFLVLLVCIISVSIIVSFNIYNIVKTNKENLAQFEYQLRDQSDAKLKAQVQTAVSLIKSVYEKQQKGLLTEAEAKKQSADLIRDLRYNSTEYFWIDTYEGVNVVLAPKPEVEGTNRSASKDSTGKLFIQEILKNGMNNDGGYTDYLFPKMGSDIPLPKRGYSLAFAPYKWIVGTGYYIDYIDTLVLEKQAEFNKQLISKIISEVVLFILAVLISSIISILFSKRMTKPIAMLTELIKKTSELNLADENDYTSITKSKDEIGIMAQNTIAMRNAIQNIITRIDDAAKMVAQSSREISSGNDNLAQRTQEQAASLEETSSAIEELTATVKQNADNAQKTNKMSENVIVTLTQGNYVVNETIQAMKDATQSSKKINEIINVVNDIAFQTNLLALNAAVEAARAGEQGKGFAVVASEVRNLAQRSAEAAKEIQGLIKDSVDKIQNGNELVLKTGEHLGNITENIQNMTNLISDIAAASREQSVGIEEVNKAIVQMDQVTQQNAALVQEAAASSEAMSAEAQQLSQLVANFKL